MLREMVLKNRSYRRFFEDAAIGRDTLVELVDLARNTASARNLQPLRYILSADRETNARIFPNLFWAMDLKYPESVEGCISTYWKGLWEKTDPKLKDKTKAPKRRRGYRIISEPKRMPTLIRARIQRKP